MTPFPITVVNTSLRIHSTRRCAPNSSRAAGGPGDARNQRANRTRPTSLLAAVAGTRWRRSWSRGMVDSGRRLVGGSAAHGSAVCTGSRGLIPLAQLKAGLLAQLKAVLWLRLSEVQMRGQGTRACSARSRQLSRVSLMPCLILGPTCRCPHPHQVLYSSCSLPLHGIFSVQCIVFRKRGNANI